jgi:outer membrane receptor protein involved in Fe transport
MVRGKYWLVVVWSVALSLSAQAQQDKQLKRLGDELFQLSIEELMDIPVSVATKKELSIRETPGIVSVITQEEIRNSGARDLIDVLRLVPGFEFGGDLQGSVGLGVRGIYAFEGKASVFLNGTPMNDLLFGNLLLGHRFNPDQIKRIEIIRGPGSAIYGGTSELAVINIVTVDEELNGAEATLMHGQMQEVPGRSRLTLSWGQPLGKDWEVSLSASYLQGVRSDKTYRDVDDTTFEMEDNSAIRTRNVFVGIKKGNFQLNYLNDSYHLRHRNGYGKALSEDTDHLTDYHHLQAKYRWQLSERWELRPLFQYLWQHPWVSNDPNVFEWSNRTARRTLLGLESNFQSGKERNGWDITFGGQAYQDYAKVLYYGPDPSLSTQIPSPDDTSRLPKVTYYNYTAYVQAIWQRNQWTFTLGARDDYHTGYGNAFVPRVGLTFVDAKFHSKLLASRAFRAPNICSTNPAVQPEYATVLELELGYQLMRSLFWTLNLYDITIDKPLYYTGGLYGYENGNKLGTRGFETELRWVQSHLKASLNYSFYTTDGKENDKLYTVLPEYFAHPTTDVPAAMQAFARHRIGLTLDYALSQKINLHINNLYLGERYAFDYYDGVEYRMRRFEPVLLTNVYVRVKEIVKGLELGAGVYDLLGSNYAFLVPYDAGGMAPTPAPSREWVVKLRYAFTRK